MMVLAIIVLVALLVVVLSALWISVAYNRDLTRRLDNDAILLAWESADLSEGQAVRLLRSSKGMDRIAARMLRQFRIDRGLALAEHDRLSRSGCKHPLDRRASYEPAHSTGDESDYTQRCLDCGALLR